jgi:hypothetical protein
VRDLMTRGPTEWAAADVAAALKGATEAKIVEVLDRQPDGPGPAHHVRAARGAALALGRVRQSPRLVRWAEGQERSPRRIAGRFARRR